MNTETPELENFGPVVLLARHGETDFNLKKIFQGRTDNPLNETGLKQAEMLGERLEGFSFQSAYVSPLIRAKRTVEIALRGKEVEFEVDDRLIELDFGEWEGTPEAEVKEKYMDEYAAYRRDMSKFHPSGGECAQDAMHRSGGWWDDVKVNYSADETVLVVAHQSVNACLGCFIAEIDLKDAWDNFKSGPGELIRIVPGRLAQISRIL